LGGESPAPTARLLVLLHTSCRAAQSGTQIIIIIIFCFFIVILFVIYNETRRAHYCKDV
jgi:hypothetical protein